MTARTLPQVASQPRLALRPREAAAMLGPSTRTLWAWSKFGIIPCLRVTRGRRVTTLYSPSSLQAWLEMQADKGRCRVSKCETCLNLLETFGDRYQIRWEEPANSRWTDPWYQLIPCRLGHIYPHGGDLLGFASRRRGGVTRRVASLPYATVMQAGDGGANILFPADRFFEVAMMVHPRQRRRLTDAQRAAAIERLQRYWPASGQDSARAAVQRGSEALERVRLALVDPEAHIASGEVLGLAEV